MPKSKSIYICSECGFESAKWYGKCPGCGEWNTMNEEFKEAVKHTASVLRPGESGRLKAAPILINEINTTTSSDITPDSRNWTGCWEAVL